MGDLRIDIAWGISHQSDHRANQGMTDETTSLVGIHSFWCWDRDRCKVVGLCAGKMSGPAKFFILLAVAVVIVGLYESDQPVNTGEEILTILVICGMIYFWMENKRSA